MIGFMEFCGLLLILMVITQIMIPLFVPKSFEFFWLFRKNKAPEKAKNVGELKDEVEQIKVLKKSINEVIKKIRKKTEKNLEDAQKLNNKLDEQ